MNAAASEKPLDGLKVLLVEDAEDIRLLLSKMIGKFGARIETSDDGREAASRAFEGNFDIILLDLQMPDFDGYETLGLLRRQGYRKPVIALSAFAQQEERDRSLKAGFDDYVPKPIDWPVLIDAIRRHRRKE